jgi:hypothetical protein
MANTLVSPTAGFQAFGRMEGGSPTAGLTPCWIASTDATAFFRGDAIVTSSGGGTNLSGNYITSIVNSVSTGLVRGVFMGCEYFQPTVGRTIWSNTWPGTVTNSTGDIRAYIIDDPGQLFLVQGSTNVAITSSFIGLNIAVSANSSTGNATSGLSNMQVTSSLIGSTNGLPFRIVDFYSAYAPPGLPAVGTGAFINGTDNTTAANMVIVRLNNCDRLNLTARSS